MGDANYRHEDTAALLDLVEEHEPIGANHWAKVANEFNRWAEANQRPKRSTESLKNKSDKLVYTRKKTGDAFCPDVVRRAKIIQRNIRKHIAAVNIGDESEEDPVQETFSNLRARKRALEQHADRSDQKPVKKQATISESVVPLSRRMQLDLLDHIQRMSASVSRLANNQAQNVQRAAEDKDDIRSIIRKEIATTLKDILLHSNQSPSTE